MLAASSISPSRPRDGVLASGASRLRPDQAARATGLGTVTSHRPAQRRLTRISPPEYEKCGSSNSASFEAAVVTVTKPAAHPSTSPPAGANPRRLSRSPSKIRDRADFQYSLPPYSPSHGRRRAADKGEEIAPF